MKEDNIIIETVSVTIKARKLKDLDKWTLEEPQLMKFDFSDELLEELDKQLLIEQLIKTAEKDND